LPVGVYPTGIFFPIVYSFPLDGSQPWEPTLQRILNQVSLMKFLSSSTAAFLLGLSLTAPLVSANSLFEKLPSDAFFAIGVSNYPEVEERTQKSNLGKAWNSAEMASLKEGWLEVLTEMDTDMETQTGSKLSEFKEHFHGDVVAYGLVPFVGNKDNHSHILAFEYDPEKLEDLRQDVDAAITKLEEKSTLTKTQYEFQGVAIRQITFEEVNTVAEWDDEASDVVEVEVSELVTLEYSFLEDKNIFFVAKGLNSPVKSFVNSLQNENAERLTQTASFQAYQNLVSPKYDVIAFMQIDQLMQTLKSLPEDHEAYNADALRFFDLSGLGEIPAAGFQMSLLDGGMYSEYAVLVPRVRKGILAALYPESSVSLSTATSVPKNALTYNSFQFDFDRVWVAITQLVSEMNPESKVQLDQMLLMANAQTQTNIENNLLKNIAGEHFNYTIRDPKGAELSEQRSAELGFTVPESPIYSFSINTRDAQLAHSAINSIMEVSTTNFGMPYVKSDFNSVTIWEPNEESQQSSGPVSMPGIVLLPGKIGIVMNEEETRALIRRSTGMEKESIVDNPDYQRIVSGIDKEFLMVFGYNSPENLPFVMRTLEQQMIDEMELEEELQFPSEQWYKNYFGPVYNTLYARPEGFHGNGLMEFVPAK
jgi:hypothetical protein